jgi:hypothetical protein
MIPKITDKTTPREEWSYILLVLHELLSMGCEKLFHNFHSFFLKKYEEKMAKKIKLC